MTKGSWYGSEEAEEFSYQLKAFREKKSISQALLAKKAGTNHATISRYEDGSRRPNSDILEKMIEVLSLTPKEANILRKTCRYPVSEINKVNPVIAELNDFFEDPNVDERRKEKVESAILFFLKLIY